MAENVARMIINRDRSGTESLRKGDLLPKMSFLGGSYAYTEEDGLYPILS